MIGAIIGDVIGSRFERWNTKEKDFELFTNQSTFTDDTVLSIAIAEALLSDKDYATHLKKLGKAYPFAGYGGTFKKWLAGIIQGPYNSWGNGSAMRVSPVAYAFDTIEEVLLEAEKSAAVTHNHPEGIKGAQAIASAVFLARKGGDKDSIRSFVSEHFSYNLDRKIAHIRPYYEFDVSCQGSVPEAIIAFLESSDFEDAIRTAISIGGDSDTIACMAGAIAEAFYQEIPENILSQTKERLPKNFLEIVNRFHNKYYI